MGDLPILADDIMRRYLGGRIGEPVDRLGALLHAGMVQHDHGDRQGRLVAIGGSRSERHTYELQSLMRSAYAVARSRPQVIGCSPTPVSKTIDEQHKLIQT